MLDERIKSIIEFIGENMERESGLLYPNPSWIVFAVPLLDAIAEVYDVTKEDVGGVINPVRKRIEAERKHYANNREGQV